jgi:hypothetical protein
MNPEAGSVVREYFRRIQGRDPGVADLFAEDASLIGLGDVKSGRETIREFYAGIMRSAGPTPSIVGDLLIADGRIAAEIQISLADGSSVHAVDMFVVESGLIRSLTYFIADH